MNGDYRLIPPGESCSGCPYWRMLAAQTTPGGVPRSRCAYLGIEDNPLVDDHIKICGVDLPRTLYRGFPLAGEAARLDERLVLVVHAGHDGRRLVFDGAAEFFVDGGKLAFTPHAVNAPSLDAWLVWRAARAAADGAAAEPKALLMRAFLDARVETGYDRNGSHAADRYVAFTAGLGWNSADLRSYGDELATAMAESGLAALAKAGWGWRNETLDAKNAGQIEAVADAIRSVRIAPAETPTINWFWLKNGETDAGLDAPDWLGVPGLAEALADKMAATALAALTAAGGPLVRA